MANCSEIRVLICRWHLCMWGGEIEGMNCFIQIDSGEQIVITSKEMEQWQSQ
jgi:hypothetical protein